MNPRDSHQTVVGMVALLILLVAGAWSARPARAQVPRELNYQGFLTVPGTGAPVNATVPMVFRLYNVGSGGLALYTETHSVTVTSGIFNVVIGSVTPLALPFDVPYFLGIAVGADPEMAPRQPVAASPYALRAANADALASVATVTGAQITGTIGTAQIADNAVTQAKLAATGTVAAGKVLGTDGTSLQWLAPTGVSTAYIQNGTVLQPAANFNISGNGTAGGTLSGNVVNTATQYNLGNSRVFSVSGVGLNLNSNVFAGIGAGASDTPAPDSSAAGSNNSFYGFNAGNLNTTGCCNSFFGNRAGQNNTGSKNSFFGSYAGFDNTTGAGNAYFGDQAGVLSTTGSSNSFFGSQAGSSNTTGGGNSFFGLQAGANNTTGLNNTFIGVGAGNPNAATQVSNSVAIGAGAKVSTDHTIVLGTAAETTQIPGGLSVAGSTTYGGTLGANIINATTEYDLNGSAVLIGDTNNTFAGLSAGTNNTPTGVHNSFFGFGAGFFNDNGGDNSFFGHLAGVNSTGFSNSFFGSFAGENNATGSENSFFGRQAGVTNTTGSNNAFFGRSAGSANSTGTGNVFVGRGAGQSTQTGNGNAFFGDLAGTNNTTGGNNTFIGNGTGASFGGVTNATAIGSNAFVTQSNTLVLGGIAGVNGAISSTLVGIGTTAPLAQLEVNGQGGVALAITNGAIRVTGAGVGSNTAAFIFVKTAANTCGGAGGAQSAIDNRYTNGDPNAILIITPRAIEGGVGGTFSRVGAVYVPAASIPPSCPQLADKWTVFASDGSPEGSQFSILVIKP